MPYLSPMLLPQSQTQNNRVHAHLHALLHVPGEGLLPGYYHLRPVCVSASQVVHVTGNS